MGILDKNQLNYLMKNTKYLLSLLLLLCFWRVEAQNKFTVSGHVRDKSSGEELIGATILVAELPTVGVTTNEYGFYSLTLPQGTYTLKSFYVGYTEMKQPVNLEADQKIDWAVTSDNQLQEVVLSSVKEDENITRTTMGTERLDIKEISKLPVLFGEKDVLKTLQLLPGIKSAGEGNSGFYVRGGSSDQNLILLDEAPVYNASHLLGFFSTFNSDAIKDATIIKGNTPAQYGGRLASVLDVRMREGNDKTYNVSGGIGLISSRLTIEAPIQKDKSSFMIAGRRTYADVFLKATENFKDNRLYFYDLNMKANYRINDKNRVFLSGYFGRDNLGLGDAFGIDWGNRTATFRWNSILNPKLFSNTSFIYSDYSYNIKINAGGTKFKIDSQIQDWNLKQEFQFFPNNKNSWRFGVNSIHHTLTPSRFEIESNKNVNSQVSRYGWENAIYANNTYNANTRLNVEYGLRVSAYSILGGDKYNIYEKDVKKDSVVLAKGSIGRTYYNLEPRLSGSYKLDDKSSVKAGYARNTQHLHLLSNSTSTSPTDQWIGNSYNIKPEISDQISIGYFRNFKDNAYEFSVETYYKFMQNQVDYKNGADITTAIDVESELLYGNGRAYGVELFLKKKKGKFTGWISYTLARTEREIDGINDGMWYKARQDRLHDLSIVAMYQLSTTWSLSSVFVYYTGNAVTFPSGKYEIDGNVTNYYTERNGYRMPAYHRLDFSAVYERKREGRFQGSWNFGIYNTYGRQNAYLIDFQEDPNDASRTQVIQTALFRWIPSVTYNFKF